MYLLKLVWWTLEIILCPKIWGTEGLKQIQINFLEVIKVFMPLPPPTHTYAHKDMHAPLPRLNGSPNLVAVQFVCFFFAGSGWRKVIEVNEIWMKL